MPPWYRNLLTKSTKAADDTEELLDTSNVESWNLHGNMQKTDTQEVVEETKVFSTVTDKSVKSGDASIPVHLWNDRIALGLQDLRKEENKTFPFDFTNDDVCLRFHRRLEGFRKLGLIVWKKNIRRSLWKWFGEVGKHRDEKEV